MNMKNKKEPQVDLDDEYGRIAENEMIYLDEIALWERLGRIATYLIVVPFIAIVTVSFFLPPNTPILNLESFRDYPLQISISWIVIVLVFFSLVAIPLSGVKTSKIRKELGLHREERIYLRAYETSTTIDSYLSESNPKRKLYFKRLALQNAQELTEIVDGWKYGNIRLIADLIGDKIDLLKDNMRRLVLSNVAKGDEGALKKISRILMELCKYIHSPTLEKLDELNNMIREIPFKEYKYLTKKEKMGAYFYSRPRMFRLVFASGITITVVVVLLCLDQNLGLAIAVGVTCFWGSFAGFDKLFRIKEKESV